MEWERRSDGDLKMAILRNAEMAVAPDQAVAMRLEYAEVQEQMTGAVPLTWIQLVMSPEDAEALAAEILQAALLARKTVGEA